MENLYKTYYNSEIGLIEISGTAEHIVSVEFTELEALVASTMLPKNLKDCVMQLDEYFKGIRKEFDINAKPGGTDFQNNVWKELKKISYGKTFSYLDIAKSINDPGSVRAVGNANGKNKIAIIIPCHRVIGSNGTLTGYAGGLWRKQWLLNHEQSFSKQAQMLLF